MLALMLGDAMALVPASQRGSLNATLNAVYQTGATVGGLVERVALRDSRRLHSEQRHVLHHVHHFGALVVEHP